MWNSVAQQNTFTYSHVVSLSGFPWQFPLIILKDPLLKKKRRSTATICFGLYHLGISWSSPATVGGRETHKTTFFWGKRAISCYSQPSIHSFIATGSDPTECASSSGEKASKCDGGYCVNAYLMRKI